VVEEADQEDMEDQWDLHMEGEQHLADPAQVLHIHHTPLGIRGQTRKTRASPTHRHKVGESLPEEGWD
jgi:hypothetical protein